MLQSFVVRPGFRRRLAEARSSQHPAAPWRTSSSESVKPPNPGSTDHGSCCSPPVAPVVRGSSTGAFVVINTTRWSDVIRPVPIGIGGALCGSVTGGSERSCQTEMTLHALISGPFLRRQLPGDGFTTAANGPNNPGENVLGKRVVRIWGPNLASPSKWRIPHLAPVGVRYFPGAASFSSSEAIPS